MKRKSKSKPMNVIVLLTTSLFLGYCQSIMGQTVVPPGEVFGWGVNPATYWPWPYLVPTNLVNVSSLSIGWSFSAALQADGSVVYWKNYERIPNTYGTTEFAAVACSDRDLAVLSRDGRVVIVTSSQTIFSNVVALAAGYDFFAGITRSGTLVGYGSTPPTDITDAIAVAAYSHHGLALRSNGCVVAWGEYADTTLEPPSGLTNVVAIATGLYHSLAVKADSTVECWGDDRWLQCSPPAFLSNVVAVAAGDYHSLALRRDSSVVAWGGDYYGQTRGASGVLGVSSLATYRSMVLVAGGPLAAQPFIVMQPESRLVTIGASPKFEVTVTGPGPIRFQWQFNGTNLPGETARTLFLSNVQPAQAGNYQVIVDNAFGSVNSSAAQLTLVATPDFQVTSLADRGDGSLRSALMDASYSGGGNIRFSNVVGQIVLNTDLPAIDRNTSLLGLGSDIVTISGGGAARCLTVNGPNNLISGVSLADGFVEGTNGGGILNLGSLMISNCAVVGNQAKSGLGGGIYSSGNLIVRDSMIIDNAVDSGAFSSLTANRPLLGGGGIYVAGGSVILSNSTIAGNTVVGESFPTAYCAWPSNGAGGGIFQLKGTLTLQNCSVAGNTSRGALGGVYDNGSCSGGGGMGGGLYVEQGTTALSSCTVYSNLAVGGFSGGGGGLIGGPGGSGYGGGLFLRGGTVRLTNSTISGNVAAGEDGSSGGHYGGSGGNADYGAAQISGGFLQMVNCTVISNRAVAGKGAPGQYPGQSGYSYVNGIGVNSNCETVNSIIGDNSPGKFNSLGYNLFGSTNYVGGLTATDSNGFIRLGPLQDNGGLTPTHALLPGSGGIDTGTPLGAPAMDQRGTARPQATGVDIGAFELVASGPPRIVVFPSNLLVIAGTNVSLCGEAVGTPPLAYQWRRDGVALDHGSTATLSFPHVQSSAAGSYTLVVSNAFGAVTSSPVTLTVHFSLELTRPFGGDVLVTPSLTSYPPGTIVTLTVSTWTSYNWTFLGWRGDVQGTTRTITLVMSKNHCVEAVLAAPVTAYNSVDGRIEMTPKAGLYPNFARIKLTAVPNPGNYFVDWSCCFSGGISNPVTVLALWVAPGSVRANFAPNPVGHVSLAVVESGLGRVNWSRWTNLFEAGSIVTLTPVPDPDQDFLGWSGDASGISTNLVLTLNANKVVTALFTSRPRLDVGPCSGGMTKDGFLLTIEGELGHEYLIEQSTNLAQWSSVVAETNILGTIQWLDPATTNSPHRYYRTRMLH